MVLWHRFKDWARRLKREVKAIGLALLDSRTPWYAKVLAGFIVAYALSPIDLIPDAIPVLGLIDEMIILPILIAGVVRLIPSAVMADCRNRIDEEIAMPRWLPWTGLAVMIVIWLATGVVVANWLWEF